MAENKLREQIRATFLAALEQERLPWKKGWQSGRPFNGATGRFYSGVNTAWLSYIAEENGWEDPRWATYKQAQDKGWQVRKGEKGTKAEYWYFYDSFGKKSLNWEEYRKLAGTEYEHKYLQLRFNLHTVFNAAQMDGVPPLVQNQTDIGALRTQRDILISNMAVGYREEGKRAYYSPGEDRITLPPEASFDDEYSYLCTFLHEAGHATGHPSRLNRDLSGFRGGEQYAREELRAEIASAFTAQAIGLQLTDAQLAYHMDQHKAYIQAWANVLRDAPGELFKAIQEAERISDYLLDKGRFPLARQPEELTVESEILPSDQLADAWEKPGPTEALSAQAGQQNQRLGQAVTYGDSEEAPAVEYFMTRDLRTGGVILHITGPERLPDFDSEQQRPWQPQADEITGAVVEEGVRTVGSRTFYRLPALEKVSLASSVEALGSLAINDCPALQSVEYRGDAAAWERVEKGWNYLPSEFSQESWERHWGHTRESYLPVAARPDADGRPQTVSSDFTPDAIIRTGGSGQQTAAVEPTFRTETLDVSKVPEPEME